MTEPVTVAARSLIITSGFIRASEDLKLICTFWPSFAKPPGVANFSPDCLISTNSNVGAIPSAPAGSGRSFSVTVFPPPPQAARNSEKDNARTEPK